MSQVTGMFYNAGRLFFTLAGDPGLHWAWFSPDSGIVDNTEFSVPSSVDFSQADGMFVSGNTLYYVKKGDQSLYSVSFDGSSVSGSPQLINGPSTGGIDWTNRSLFFAPSPPANKAPTAAFTSSCTAGGCSLDGSTSSDSDGSLVGYTWDFGDGSSAGSGVTTSHAYTAIGTYTVKLTVTDNSGATSSVTHQVSITSLSQQIQFVAASHSAPGSSTSKSVTVPASVAAGDTMLLVLTGVHLQHLEQPGPGLDAGGADADQRHHQLDRVGQAGHGRRRRVEDHPDVGHRRQGNPEPERLRRRQPEHSRRRRGGCRRRRRHEPRDADHHGRSG